MASRRKDPWRFFKQFEQTCPGKRPYDTVLEAQVAANAANQGSVPYLCGACNKYHNGRSIHRKSDRRAFSKRHKEFAY